MSKKLNSKLKESYEVITRYEAFYTGGKIQFTKNGEKILTICQDKMKCFELKSGKTTNPVTNFDGEDITAFILADDDSTLVTAAKNGILRHWNLSDKHLEKTWKSIHSGPINCMDLDSTITLLATGGTDSTVKIWDIHRKYYTHNLKGGQGVYSKVCFQKITDVLYVFGAADDYQIHVWNLHTSDLVVTLPGHYGTITDLVFLHDNKMLSCGRDKVVLLWDISTHKLIKTIPIYETVESCILVPEELKLPNMKFDQNDTYFITAGDKGMLRVWSMNKSVCIYEQEDSMIVLPEDTNYDGPLIVQAIYIPAMQAFGVVTFEHNIMIYSSENFILKNQFVGYNDDILSIKYCSENNSQIAVATNSSQIKIFDVPSFSCKLLKGHSDIVMSLDVFLKHPNILVSGSKDNNIKVWELVNGYVNCIYTGFGHTDSVTTVCCCRKKSKFFVSGSEDTTLKLWEVPEKRPLVALKQLLAPHSTVKAHDRLINTVDISGNDKLIASGSQDHTAKLWDATNLSLIGIFRGHTKGVWCVKFSPVDLVLASSSGDETIRMWSISDFSCLKILQGHEVSVLQVLFLSQGLQLLSSGSDGSIKLWDIRNNMCVKTYSEHEFKVWTLTTSHDEQYFVSGGADSNILLWNDTTKSEKEKQAIIKEEFIVQEQELSNLVHEKKWPKALCLAINLNKPYKAFCIIEEILLHEGGEKILKQIFSTLRKDQIESLMRFSEEWTTNSKTCYAAMLVTNFIYRSFDSEELHKLSNFSTFIQNTLPYQDRHFKRLNRRCQDVQIVNFLCNQYKLNDFLESDDISTKRLLSDNEESLQNGKKVCRENLVS